MPLSSTEIQHEGYHLAIDMLNGILAGLDPNAEAAHRPSQASNGFRELRSAARRSLSAYG